MLNKLVSAAKSFSRDERGASLVEYSVLVGLITAALVAAIVALSGQISAAFTAISTVLSANRAGR
jgi:pilus assembly protein Flp/PilA